ncbi:hypothetical protein UKS_09430 [Streptococcus sp. 116-D4]|nr:hypothetical protein UKS_09430 [Streptococcus sp. 116-D4]
MASLRRVPSISKASSLIIGLPSLSFGIIIACFGGNKDYYVNLGRLDDNLRFEEDNWQIYAILNLSKLQLDKYKKTNLK